jgi:hypothetical protein
MFQFGEVLTVVIAAVALAYLLANWGRVRAVPWLRPLVVPFLLVAVGWLWSVLEDIAVSGSPQPLFALVRDRPSQGGASSAWASACNALEHVFCAAAALGLLAAMWRVGSRPKGEGADR